MQLRTFEYRLYPSRKQEERLIKSLNVCKHIYNELLNLSIDTYNLKGVSLSRFDYNAYLAGKYSEIYSKSRENVADRVSKAFNNFFQKVKDKSCKKKGFPRFKSKVRSITYPQARTKRGRCCFWFVSDKRLRISRIGNVPIVLHRVPSGKIKSLTVKQNNANQWFATFVCELPDAQGMKGPVPSIGLDFGLEKFVTFSNGESEINPRYSLRSEKRMRMLQRKVGRKMKGSKNRHKSQFKVAKLSNRIVNQRKDFLHKLSRKLTSRFGRIYVEHLKIQNMMRNHTLAKHIADAGWNSFVQMLSYKAVTCGGQLIKVNPRNTSKACSSCGSLMNMPLSQRQFVCSSCGFAAHRDVNAAKNILKVGADCTELNACGDSTSTPSKEVACGVVEAGTTLGNI